MPRVGHGRVIRAVHRAEAPDAEGTQYGRRRQPAGVALLEQVLRADIERLVFPALEVAKVTGGALGVALA